MNKRVFLLAACCAAAFHPAPACAAATQSVAATAAQTKTTFTMPPAWKREQPSPEVTLLSAPEGNLALAIVEVGAAADGKEAADAAWKAYRPAGIHPFKLATDRPGRNGWDQSVVVEYE